MNEDGIIPMEPDDQAQAELARERWELAVRALDRFYELGGSQADLDTLARELGVEYRPPRDSISGDLF